MAGGVPFAERDGAVPALIDGLFKGLESFGGVLGLVAFKSALVILEILWSVGDGDVEIGRVGGMERKGGRPDGVERLGLLGSEAGIVELDFGFV